MNQPGKRAGPDLDQIKKLVQRLAETEAAIQSLIAGQADAIIDPHSGALILLQQAQQALQRSEARYHRLLTHLSAVVFELGAEGKVFFVNDNVERVTGYSPPELLGRNWWNIFLPGEYHRRVDELLRMLRKGDVDHYQCCWIKKDGSPITVELSSANRYEKTGELTSVVGFATDITTRMQAEDRLRQAAAVYEATPNAIIIADRDRRIRAVNSAYTKITGYSAHEVIGRNPRLQQSGRHDREFYEELWRSVEDSGHWQGEIWNRRKNGEIYPAWETVSAVRDDKGQIISYVSVFTDITAIKASEAKLDYMAHHDALTGVANRSLLGMYISVLIPRARRRSQAFALLFLDLDRFKSVNDVYGHEYGDRLLQMVTTRVGTCVRAEDMLARVGGDEFVLVLEDINEPRDVAGTAEKIIEVLAQPFDIEGREIFTSMSIGISLYPDDGETDDDLIRAADTAMYSAKLQGRNRYQFSTLELTQRAREYFSLHAGLSQALARNEFLVHYQPQVALHSGEIVGVEALIRWQHPQRGLVMPEQFIPIAEETGLINAIGEWVLRTACTEVASWERAAPVRIAVNLSGRQIVHNQLAEQVRSILEQTGLEPSRLELEITESVLQNSRESIEVLEGLSRLGVRLAIDDFGTGYSSLGQLKRLPINTLKIDQSFIRDILGDPDDEAITAAIIGMAHTLKLKVVAEGVERPEQLDFLRARGCDECQGMLFSSPLPGPAVRRLLVDGSRLR